MSVDVMIASPGSPCPPAAIVVPDHAAWLRNYGAIRAASTDPQQRLQVVLAEACLPAVQADLDGLNGVLVRFLSGRAELERLWRQPVPEILSEGAIAALRLTELVPPPGADLVAFVLGQAYGAEHVELFASPRLDAAAETRLVWLLLAPPVCADDARPAVDAFLRARLDYWSRHGSRLAADLAANASAAAGVALRSILARYPSDVRRDVLAAWPGPEARGSAQSVVRLPDDPGVARLPASFGIRLEAALRPRLVDLIGPGYLDHVSGVVPAELDTLRRAEGSLLRALDPDAVRDRFFALGSARVEAAIIDINLAVRAEQSMDGEGLERALAEGGFDRVVSFYREEYLPLKERFGARHATRTRLIDWNEAYSRWLIAGYPRLLGARGSGASPFAADILHETIAACITAGGLPIVLMIDGLGWPAYRRLVAAAEHNGISLAGERVALAPLPTVTSIAMTNLVAGVEVGSVGPDDTRPAALPELRRRAFGERYPGAVFGGAGSASQVDEAMRRPGPVWVLHTLVVDRLVHDPDVADDVLRAWLDSYLDELWRAVTDAIARNLPEERRGDVRLIVATDHGYTGLLREEPVHAPPRLGAIESPVQVSGRHQRCLRLSASEAGLGSEIRAQLAVDWFVLEGERFGLPADSVWLVPREQRATASGVQRTHGGASLDETLVPVASFVLRSPSAPTLVVTLDGRLVAGSPSPAMLMIANLSTRVLRAVSVRISALGVSMEVGRIEPEDVVARPVTVLAIRSGQVEVTATVSALGEPRQSVSVRASVDPSEAERLLGDDRLGNFFAEEGR